MTDSIQWFYVDTEDGESKGPITTDQIKQLPSDTYVWNNSTVNEWTQLKNTELLPNQSIISNTQIEQEYDCQYMSDEIIEQQSDTNEQTNHTNQQIDTHNINDNNENKINENVTKPSNNKLNLMTLAALSNCATNDTDEEIIDEELTPEPTNIMMNIPTNIMTNIPKNIIEKSDNKNNEIKVNNNTNELCIDTSKKIDNRINNKSIFSPDMPLQDFENNSLPKPFDNTSSNYIIHKIPKQGNKQIIAQPPSVSSFNKKNTNLQTQNIIACPLCTFHNDINAIQCNMCETKLDRNENIIENKNIKQKQIENKNINIKKMNELDKQLEELMNNLEIPNTARISIRKLPKDKKIQMINQYENQMKNSNNYDKKQKFKKEKKNSLFKKNKKKRDSQSNNDYIYIFKDSNNKLNNKPLTVNIDDMIDQRLTNNINKNIPKKQIEKSNSIQTEHKQKQISVYDGYINKYNKSPQNATQLMKFSKLKNEFKPLTFKQAKNILNEQKQNKCEKKTKVSKFWGKKKAKKVDENVDIFVPSMPRAVTAPIQLKKQVTQTIKKQPQKVKKIKSIWDINENEGDDPMGSTYRKKVIINNYNKSKIIEQTAESVMKDKMGIISPETVQMKSVFDESSSDEDDDNDNDNRLTVNLKHAKHNKVSSHVDVKL